MCPVCLLSVILQREILDGFTFMPLAIKLFKSFHLNLNKRRAFQRVNEECIFSMQALKMLKIYFLL